MNDANGVGPAELRYSDLNSWEPTNAWKSRLALWIVIKVRGKEGCTCNSPPCPLMDSVVQNGWEQLTNQYFTSIALTLLYYDYALTFDRELRLFWSGRSSKQWGSVLFFANRYCGIFGHVPIIVKMFARRASSLNTLCKPVNLYHQILAIVMQVIIGVVFIVRTYALYGRSRVVLVGLISLALVFIAVGVYMLSHGEKLPKPPALPECSDGCLVGLSWPQSWRLAVAWSGVMAFDLVVVIMTLVRTIQINRRSGEDRALAHLLIRDGVMYFGIISLASLSNIITFLYGSEITRGNATTMANILGCVLVSRLMFHLREPRKHSATMTAVGTAASAPTTTVLLQTLTKIEDFGETGTCYYPNDQRDFSDDGFNYGEHERTHSNTSPRTDIEMVQVVGHTEGRRHGV